MAEVMRRIFTILGLALAPLAAAQEAAPDVLVKQIAGEVIAALRQDKEIQAGDSRKIAALVEKKILPHFDTWRATQLAMGANWRRASAEQQEELTREFTTLVVRTYSGALAAYRDQAIVFRPLRAAPADTEVTVYSQVKQSGAEPIAIEYDLAKTGAQWKVFDIRVSGISLVATYRSSFNEEVRTHGIDGLIQSLASKNRHGAVKPVSRAM
jgi:phospholipid transport system substrate-binding protein